MFTKFGKTIHKVSPRCTAVKYLNFKNPIWWTAHSRHLEKNWKIAISHDNAERVSLCIGGPPSWILKMNFNCRCIWQRPIESCHLRWPWITLKVIRLLQGLQMEFVDYSCNISHGFSWHSASRGPSVSAELLVCAYYMAVDRSCFGGVVRIMYFRFYQWRHVCTQWLTMGDAKRRVAKVTQRGQYRTAAHTQLDPPEGSTWPGAESDDYLRLWQVNCLSEWVNVRLCIRPLPLGIASATIPIAAELNAPAASDVIEWRHI